MLALMLALMFAPTPALTPAPVPTPDEWHRQSPAASWGGQDRAAILPPHAGNGFFRRVSYLRSQYLYCILRLKSRAGFSAFSWGYRRSFLGRMTASRRSRHSVIAKTHAMVRSFLRKKTPPDGF